MNDRISKLGSIRTNLNITNLNLSQSKQTYISIMSTSLWQFILVLLDEVQSSFYIIINSTIKD